MMVKKGRGKRDVIKMRIPKRHIMLEEGQQYNIGFMHNRRKVWLSAGINPLNNNWMWWWSDSSSMYAGNRRDVYSIVKNIRRKTKVFSDGWSGRNAH